MPNSSSALSYSDIKEVLDQALAAPRGIEVEHKTVAAATRWLSRANTFRLLDRKANAKLYPEGHDLHNASPYDYFLMKREGHKVIIRPYTTEGVTVNQL